jgi:phytoene desaturase
MPSSKAIIIGSGIAGMATAIRLAAAGMEVDVFEANDYPGGKLSSFTSKGYQFDAGPSLFTQPEQIEELFRIAEVPIHDYFSYQEADVVCNYFYENGKRLKTYADKQKLAHEFETVLGESGDAVLNYLNQAERLYNNVGHIFLNHSLHEPRTWLHRRIFKAITTVRPSHLFKTLHGHNTEAFKSPEAVQLFNRFATYNGSNPYKAPAMLSLIPHLEQNQGTFYPKGGMISITNALHQLATKKGVRFHFGSRADKIIKENGKAVGVLVNQQTHHADYVISNGDVYYTYKHLLDFEQQSKKIEKLERSSSALIFYWGIRHEFSALGLHNIFFSNNYNEEFSCIFEQGRCYHDPTVYINITSKMESGQAPQGAENWFVMVNVPANTGQDWDALKQQVRQSIFNKLSRMLQTDIESKIETEHVLDPVSIESKTGTYKGSLYGTSSNSKFAAFFRPPNKSRHLDNLFFCGGTVHPGGGIPLCLRSAYITSAMIIQHDQNK